MRSYQSFRNNPSPLSVEDKTITKSCNFFDFQMNHLVPCEFSHFQLRRNVQCVSGEEVYIKVKQNKIAKYNPITREQEIIAHPAFPAVSFDVFGNYIIIGGMEGELSLLDLQGNSKFSIVLTTAVSRITNSCKIFSDQGTLNLLVCNNDKTLRVMDPNTQEAKKTVEFESCVNHAAVSGDLKKIGVCLDSTEDIVVDFNTGKEIFKLVGHTDFGFSIDWDPSNDYCLATGNQDCSTMIWDIRQGSVLSPVHVLRTELGAALNVKYSSNGKYLAFAESADFVNIFDKRDYLQKQTMDFFGEISGFCFCDDDPDNLSMFIGMADSRYCSIIEVQENQSLRSILI